MTGAGNACDRRGYLGAGRVLHPSADGSVGLLSVDFTGDAAEIRRAGSRHRAEWRNERVREDLAWTEKSRAHRRRAEQHRVRQRLGLRGLLNHLSTASEAKVRGFGKVHEHLETGDTKKQHASYWSSAK